MAVVEPLGGFHGFLWCYYVTDGIPDLRLTHGVANSFLPRAHQDKSNGPNPNPIISVSMIYCVALVHSKKQRASGRFDLNRQQKLP